MATADFTGTTGEKVDKLIPAVVSIMATLRMLRTLGLVTLPLVVALTAFIVGKLYDNGSKVDRLADRIERLEQRVDKIEQHLEKMDGKLDRLLEKK